VLAVYHDGTASRRRNRAMLLLLARLGLRPQDVISRCLDDIDWADGRVDLQPGKTHRARSLPLPQDVGQALVAYRPGDRPQSA
jgi:integrase